ncbi:8-amino-7-oxononanoate synthase [Entomomonas asaccharolytica]|uniref:8-amino-7-oxononanoate synthase n=1 Tax=Entomomonas asaccharolytica TaxID=2785331 RepID=A0A974NHN8_9GAMM|nr:8-amino-7-oxononanoate synthase [Entomomonas asaccharolytica]QQP87045.1 8-amino-7-oxononanoate synthase [Entomomonas asaccharolytica]
MSFDLAARCAEQKAKHLYRSRLNLQSPQTPEVKINGQDYLAFCSNDYLGLAAHSKVIEALQLGAKQWGVGGGASHLVIGHSEPHHQLELELAKWTKRERVLLFTTGYMANLAAVTSLVGKQDTILEDRLNHASLLDAGLLSGARFFRYQHNNPANLQLRLKRAQGDTLIVTDGVFSMDGDLANLPAICQVAKQHQAWVMVDDAHGFGVLGENGGGIVEHFGLTTADVPVLVGTLGKAFGTSGAFIAGSEDLIEILIQFARPYIYTTSQSPAIAAATLQSLQLIQQQAWRRTHLNNLIKLFREGAGQIGLPVMDSQTAIQPILIGSSEQAMQFSEALKEQHILVTAIRPPTVPSGSARLRITLTAAHTENHIEQLLQALAICWQRFKGSNK